MPYDLEWPIEWADARGQERAGATRSADVPGGGASASGTERRATAGTGWAIIMDQAFLYGGIKESGVGKDCSHYALEDCLIRKRITIRG
mgnify:CR=1 FL=1